MKNPPANAGDAEDVGSIPGSGISSGGGNGNPLQYFCLENSMDRGAWQATIPRVAKSWTHTQHHAQSKGDHCGLCRNIRVSLVENPMRCNQSSPSSTQLEGRPMGSKEDPAQPKIRIS